MASSAELEDPREELLDLAAALRVYLERCAASGAHGLGPASAELSASRRREPDPAGGAPRSASDAHDAHIEPAARAADAAGGAPRSASDAHDARLEPSARASGGPRVSLPAGGAREVPFDGATAAREAAKGPSPDGRLRLEVLAKELAGCTRCRLHEGRTQTVYARGTGSSGLCFVGEGPGADEDAQGYPFVGKAGQLLDRMIEAMGFSRDEVYVCNIVKCRPPKNRKPEPDEMEACRPFLAEQLELVNPEVIVALGATAVEGLLGISGGITRLRGKWRLYKGRVAVMPTFHPAYLLRSPEAKRDVWQDLQEVLRHMGRAVPGKK